MRESRKSLNKVKHIVKRCKKIVFDNQDLLDYFIQIYGEKFPSLQVEMLPLPVLNLIENNRSMVGSDVSIAGMHLDKKHKVVVGIGYNGIKQQQHIKVLDSINGLSQEIKNKIMLLFPITYGAEKDYINEIKIAVEASGVEAYYFEKYLEDDDLAKLRLFTDIYINAQTTDAFSGSVCEYLFADTLVVNAKWLHYKEVDKYRLKILEFDDFIDLTRKIDYAIQLKNLKPVGMYNRNAIWKLRSIEKCYESWLSTFNLL